MSLSSARGSIGIPCQRAHEVGPFQLQSMLVSHFVPNAGVRLSSPTLTVAYTGDTRTGSGFGRRPGSRRRTSSKPPTVTSNAQRR